MHQEESQKINLGQMGQDRTSKKQSSGSPRSKSVPNTLDARHQVGDLYELEVINLLRLNGIIPPPSSKDPKDPEDPKDPKDNKSITRAKKKYYFKQKKMFKNLVKHIEFEQKSLKEYLQAKMTVPDGRQFLEVQFDVAPHINNYSYKEMDKKLQSVFELNSGRFYKDVFKISDKVFQKTSKSMSKPKEFIHVMQIKRNIFNQNEHPNNRGQKQNPTVKIICTIMRKICMARKQETENFKEELFDKINENFLAVSQMSHIKYHEKVPPQIQEKFKQTNEKPVVFTLIIDTKQSHASQFIQTIGDQNAITLEKFLINKGAILNIGYVLPQSFKRINDFNKHVEQLKEEFQKARQETKGQIDELRRETRDQIDELKNMIKNFMEQVGPKKSD